MCEAVISQQGMIKNKVALLSFKYNDNFIEYISTNACAWILLTD